MDIDPVEKKFKVHSTEPFGKILIDQMRRKSDDQDVLALQYRVGKMLLDAYFESEIENAEHNGPYVDRKIISNDVARDISIKTIINARNADVEIVLGEEYFDGIEKLSISKARNLDMLVAEREVLSVAANIGYLDEFGVPADDQDLSLINEEIEEAEAAVEALDLILNLRKGNK